MFHESAGVEVRAFRITGKVQGVCFRVWTRETAMKLGLVGTVRNRADGSVETVAEGTLHTLEAFEKRLWEGPPASRVEGVERMEAEGGASFQGFEIRY